MTGMSFDLGNDLYATLHPDGHLELWRGPEHAVFSPAETYELWRLFRLPGVTPIVNRALIERARQEYEETLR